MLVKGATGLLLWRWVNRIIAKVPMQQSWRMLMNRTTGYCFVRCPVHSAADDILWNGITILSKLTQDRDFRYMLLVYVRYITFPNQFIGIFMEANIYCQWYTYFVNIRRRIQKKCQSEETKSFRLTGFLSQPTCTAMYTITFSPKHKRQNIFISCIALLVAVSLAYFVMRISSAVRWI